MSNRSSPRRTNENSLSSPTSCSCGFGPAGYPIKTKVVDIRGRLGSLYDTTTNVLIDEHSSRRYQTKSISYHKCEVFTGANLKNPISFLGRLEFSPDLQQSIRHQRVPISGVARVAEYNQPITENTRFFYYCCCTTKDKLEVKARKAHEVVPPPQGPTDADYMITKIEWGFEILCVIQIPQRVSVQAVDQLLLRIRSQLKHNQLPVRFDDNDRRIINQLDNITIFGTETCINDPYTSLHTVLGGIRNWQHNDNLHQPIIYTMQPLRWLYGRQTNPTPVRPPSNSTEPIKQAKNYMQRINDQIEDINKMFYRIPGKFPSNVLNQRLKTLQQNYQSILDRQEELDERIQKTIVDINRRQTSPGELKAHINSSRFQCLQLTEINNFRIEVERLLNKAKLIDELKKDRIEYINAFDVGSERENATATNEAIDAILRRDFSRENGVVILWYSGDRLKREDADKWKQIHGHLLATRQRASQRTRLIYVDFTQCKQRLEDQCIVRLPEHERVEHLPGKIFKKKILQLSIADLV